MRKKLTLIISGICLLFCISVMVWATDFSLDTYDIATPAGSDNPAEADDRMREIKSSIQVRENVDHIWDKTGTEVSDADTGEHRKILFHAPIASTPTVAANHGDIRIKDVANGSDTLAEIVFTNESQEELQLSSSGNNLANDTYLTATNNAGTGSVNLIKATTGDIPEILVGAVLSADTAPTVDAGVANKKYVDDEITSSDTGWISNNDWTNVHLGTTAIGNNVSHNLGANLSDLLVKILLSTDGTDNNSFEVARAFHFEDNNARNSGGVIVYQVDNNSIKVQTGTSGIMIITDSGTGIFIDNEAWFYKIKVWKFKT